MIATHGGASYLGIGSMMGAAIRHGDGLIVGAVMFLLFAGWIGFVLWDAGRV